MVPAALTPASSGMNAAQPRNRTKNRTAMIDSAANLRLRIAGDGFGADRNYERIAHAAFSALGFCGAASRCMTADAGPIIFGRPSSSTSSSSEASTTPRR